MDELPDRSLQQLTVDAKLLADVSEIMSRNGRRVVIKLDDRRIESPASVSAAELGAAREVDVSSFWVNPDRPHFGRRHFVYFLAGPDGARYFGDSISPEVKRVCEDLDVYFGRSLAGSTSAAAGHAWRPTGWVFETRERLIAAACLAGFLIALIAFLAGRWSVDTTPAFVPAGPNPDFQYTTTPDTATQPAVDPAMTAPPVTVP